MLPFLVLGGHLNYRDFVISYCLLFTKANDELIQASITVLPVCLTRSIDNCSL